MPKYLAPLDDLTHVEFLEQSIGHIPETVFCRYNPGGVFTLGEGKDDPTHPSGNQNLLKFPADTSANDGDVVGFLLRTVGYPNAAREVDIAPGGVFTLGEGKDGLQVMDTPGEAKYGMTRPQIAEAIWSQRASSFPATVMWWYEP